MTDFAGLFRALAATDARYILVGGAAATAHGATRLTQDIDVVYDRRRDNLDRLVQAMAPYEPYLRGAPPGLPFRWDVATLERGVNFRLSTTLGPIDLLGEVAGGGTYTDLLPHTVTLHLFDVQCRCVTLERLIHLKRAAGRPRDLDAIAELEAILEERRNP